MRISVVSALAALALAAPPAQADHAIARCASIGPVGGPRQLTGNTYQAVLYGYVIGGPVETVSVSCEVVAGGSTSSTAPGWGTGAAVTAGPVSWVGAAELCVEFSHSHGWERECGPFAPL